MFGALVGAGVGLIGSLMGGSQAEDAARRQQAALEKQQAENRAERAKNEAWWRTEQNRDYTQSAEAQAAISRARESAQDIVKQARGYAAVSGDTGNMVNKAQDQAMQMVGNTARDIAATSTARKDAKEALYRQTDSQLRSEGNALTQQEMALQGQRAAASAQAGGQALQAGLGLIGAAGDSYLKTGRGLFANFASGSKVQGGLNMPKMNGVGIDRLPMSVNTPKIDFGPIKPI